MLDQGTRVFNSSARLGLSLSDLAVGIESLEINQTLVAHACSSKGLLAIWRFDYRWLCGAVTLRL